jgi:hypothetical protein
MLKESDSTGPGDVVVTWLQKAFSLADQLEDAVAPGVAELKVRVMHFLTFLPLTMERSDINSTNTRYLVVNQTSGSYH